MTAEDDARRRELVADLLARGVPWPLAREAAASTALDRDETHVLPGWLREDEDGFRIVDRD